MSEFPTSFRDVADLDDYMSTPSDALVADLARIDGDIAVVGVGGKVGPTLARMAKRAAPDKKIYGISRFSESGLADKLAEAGVEPITADLLDRAAVEALPDCDNVIFMAGRKFGSQGEQSLTWAMNTYVPALVAERYAGSRTVVFSTICVYAYVPVNSGGAREDALLDPPGEYAMSCVGRERVFEHFSKVAGTPVATCRLSYAIDMRYGVLHDIGRQVLAGEPVDVTMGHVNVIWQGDACDQALRMLGHGASPAFPINVSGPETLSIRAFAELLGERLGRPPKFVGKEAETAWLADTSLAAQLFGYPKVPLRQMVDWTADWVSRGMSSLNKATRFEVRSGAY